MFSLLVTLYSNSTCHTWETFPLIFIQFFSSLNWQASSYFLDYKNLNVYILLQLLTSLWNLSNISLEDLVCRLTQKLHSQMTPRALMCVLYPGYDSCMKLNTFYCQCWVRNRKQAVLCALGFFHHSSELFLYFIRKHISLKPNANRQQMCYTSI